MEPHPDETVSFRPFMVYPAKRVHGFRYAIRDIVAAAERMEQDGRKILHLNIGDPQAFGFRPPEILTDAVSKALNCKFTGYTHSCGIFEAREAVANYATNLGAATEPKDVLITSGASEAAELALAAIVDPGDEVLVPAPGYPIYSAILTKLGAVPQYYTLDPANNWQPNPDKMRRQVTRKTRAIVLINPNNPTGSITSDNLTRKILQLAKEKWLTIISDEVYRDLCFVPPPTSASVLATEIDVPVITLESLSKTHMLSGWRAGWMRFTNVHRMPDVASAITRLASGRLCSPTPAQYAVKPALEMDLGFQREFVAHLQRNRDFAVRAINAIDGLSCTSPDAAFYLTVKVEDTRGDYDDIYVRKLLEQTGVLVVPGSGFGCGPRDGYFRLVFLADRQILDKAIAAIAEFAKGNDRAESLAA
jgi:aspartate/methionine/tyrosine aminotransferase